MLGRAPTQALNTTAMVDKNGKLTTQGLVWMQELWKQVAPGFPVVPCKCTGTNALVLTPLLASEGGLNAANYMKWSFVAAATSTGAVTAAIGNLSALKVYKPDTATQAASGDVVSGYYYELAYVASLNSGAGGLVLMGGGQPLNANLSALAGLSGSFTNFAAYTPTITSGTGAFTTVSAAGRFCQFGKLVYVTMTITITTNGTAATDVQATLPSTANSVAILTGRAHQISGKQLQGRITSADGFNLVGILNYDNTYPGSSGEVLVVSGCYEST